MARLFLAEKPSQARDIGRVLGATRRGNGCFRGDGVVVTWAYGHLLEMAPPEAYDVAFKRWSLETLPILPTESRLHVRPNVKDHFTTVQELVRRASEVVIATDADREGETIAREILDRCVHEGPVWRLWLSALDEASIRDALAKLHPGERTEPLYHAGLARSRADWLVGMNLTRAYTLAARGGGYGGVLSVGRVQTPTLKLVVDRDRAIEQFQPTPYYELWVRCTHERGQWQARWLPGKSVADGEGRCVNRQAAVAVARRVDGAGAEVALAQTERKHEGPPLPYDLSTLQQEASRRWGLGAQQVLDLAQALYERHKATTYPRTDCRYLPLSQHGDAPKVLDALARSDPDLAAVVEGAEPEVRSRAWNDGRITAHHAIIPTTAVVAVDQLSRDEYRLYDLVRRGYLAQFYPACVYDQSRIEVVAAGERFRARGRVIRNRGWRVLTGEQEVDAAEQGEQPAQRLPAVAESDRVGLAEPEVHDKQTQPPKRYTQGTLLAAMKNIAREVSDVRLKQVLKETTGIGTEATRAGIIKTLVDRGFVVETKHHLVSTAAARALIDALPQAVTDPATTAMWEQALDEIAQGKGSVEAFLERQSQWVRQLVEQVRQDGAPVVSGGEAGAATRGSGQVLGTCGCRGKGRVRIGPKAWQCSDCGALVWKTICRKRLSDKQALALFAGQTVHLKGLKSRNGKPFNTRARLVDGKVQFQFDGGDSGRNPPRPPRRGRAAS
ncbi:DNA topoisomerase III [Aquisalimonas lutea]|uniref:DNA topoisomerase III n=1 Tax=Aquisalimonas lutea TaxID=1327750 RepID=UPI0025B5FFDC|nr:DNA topoisomerase III [Aquisalimonas lutea]MDN3519001.1 DNA topoisomerase III [Aquisalimonas lutea]